MKIWIVFLCTITMAFALVATSYAPRDIAFQQGFEAGLRAMELQYKIEGVTPKKIVFEKEYLILLNTLSMPIAEILYLQNIANLEGYTTFLTQEFLIFGDFEREADAKNVSDRINRDFEVRTSVKKNSKEAFISYPVLFEKVFDLWLKEAKAKGVAIKTEVLYTEPPTTGLPQVQTETIRTIQEEYIVLKNKKAMAYARDTHNKEALSEDFSERDLMNGGEKMPFDKVITTNEGEVFYKVKNENLYFAEDDVIIKK